MSGVCDMLEVYGIGRFLKRNFCFAIFLSASLLP